MYDLNSVESMCLYSLHYRCSVKFSIGISFRMKFLVRRWHRVTSSGSININRDGFGLNPGEVKIEFFLTLVISLKLLHI